MEKGHRPHRDPEVLENSEDYKEYGPLEICVKMREYYSDLVTTKQWLALAATILLPILDLKLSMTRVDHAKNPMVESAMSVSTNSIFGDIPTAQRSRLSLLVAGLTVVVLPLV